MKNNKKTFLMNEDNSFLEDDIILIDSDIRQPKNQVEELVQGLSGAEISAQVYLVNVRLLEAYPNQPFKQYSVERLQELAEDIKRVGILSPILTRKYKNKLQILAGHNRWSAAKLAGLDQVPIMILDVDDDQAILVLTSTNLAQREFLLPSEKAFAYKMQMDALKRQGKRKENSKENSYAASLITEQTGDSRMQIHRYIRLTELEAGIIELLDKNKINMTPAVAISYLKPENQQDVLAIINKYKVFLNMEKANILKDSAAKAGDNLISIEEIQDILLKKATVNNNKILKLNYNRIAKYLPLNTTNEEIEDIIINALKKNCINNTL